MARRVGATAADGMVGGAMIEEAEREALDWLRGMVAGRVYRGPGGDQTPTGAARSVAAQMILEHASRGRRWGQRIRTGVRRRRGGA